MSNKNKQNHFLFEGNLLEVVNEYKYLGLDFHKKYNWETCKAKRIQRGWEALYSLQNGCRNAELWDWRTKKMFFGVNVLVIDLCVNTFVYIIPCNLKGNSRGVSSCGATVAT